MAIDVSGFITPEQSWGGLYKLGENFRREKAESEETARRVEAGKAASAKFLTDYLDEKQFLTGTPNDPYIVGNVQKLLREGAELIQKGVDNSQLLMALSPKVGQISQQSQTLKSIAAQKKQALDALKDNPAIDLNKFNAEFEDIYFETDSMGNRRLKDISKLDPTKKYADEILSTKAVYTPAGVDEYLKSAQLNTVGESAIITDARGGSRSAKLDVSKPNFMQLNIDPATGKLDENERFIPKYEIATDGNSPIMAQFKNMKGKDVKAPLRLLEQATFDNLMLNTNARAYIMQEAKKYAQEMGVPTSDAKVETFARAIAYDLFKGSTQHRSTFKEAEVKKEAPAPKTTNNIYTGETSGRKGEMGTPYVDMYNSIKQKAQGAGQGKLGIAMTNLNGEEIAMVLDIFNKGKGEADKKSQNNTYIKYDSGTGKLWLMDARKMPEAGQKIPSDAFLMEIPASINVKATTGAKGKQEAQKDVIEGKTATQKPEKGGTDWSKYKR